MSTAYRVRVLEQAISALERREWKNELSGWQREFLKQARKLRMKLKTKACPIPPTCESGSTPTSATGWHRQGQRTFSCERATQCRRLESRAF